MVGKEDDSLVAQAVRRLVPNSKARIFKRERVADWATPRCWHKSCEEKTNLRMKHQEALERAEADPPPWLSESLVASGKNAGGERRHRAAGRIQTRTVVLGARGPRESGQAPDSVNSAACFPALGL